MGLRSKENMNFSPAEVPKKKASFLLSLGIGLAIAFLLERILTGFFLWLYQVIPGVMDVVTRFDFVKFLVFVGSIYLFAELINLILAMKGKPLLSWAGIIIASTSWHKRLFSDIA